MNIIRLIIKIRPKLQRINACLLHMMKLTFLYSTGLSIDPQTGCLANSLGVWRSSPAKPTVTSNKYYGMMVTGPTRTTRRCTCKTSIYRDALGELSF